MVRILKRLRRGEEAQDLVEYALLAGFIAVAVASAVSVLGQAIAVKYNSVVAAF